MYIFKMIRSSSCIKGQGGGQNSKVEIVTVANALQLEAAGATPALSRFNYDAMPSLKSLNLSIAVL